jgi:Sec-independent protein translocase protein TatA
MVLVLVAIAYWLIGDVALGGLLALLGMGSDEAKKESSNFKRDAETHENQAEVYLDRSQQEQMEVDKLNEERIKVIIESEPDDTTPLNQVVKDAKKDW